MFAHAHPQTQAFSHTLHSFIHSINQSINQSFVHSIKQSFVHLFIHSFMSMSMSMSMLFIRLSVRSFGHSFILSVMVRLALSISYLSFFQSVHPCPFLVHSFICFFIHLFMRFVHPRIHSSFVPFNLSSSHAFFLSRLNPFIRLSSIIHPFTLSSIHSFIHSFIPSFIQSVIQSFSHSVTQSSSHSVSHSCIHSCIHAIIRACHSVNFFQPIMNSINSFGP